MKNLCLIAAMLSLGACHMPGREQVQTFTYRQTDIQKQFDTLYQKQQTDSPYYNGFIEQALAVCHDSTKSNDTVTQHVFSSMYFNQRTQAYDCVTNTVFALPEGTISAMGVFVLMPADTIAPDHDFPITGGSQAYKNISGTYTRQYRNGVYHVTLSYHQQ